ncbi:hypothetical protein [Salinicola salarius]|uniref:hypothetical protein n=1 Tax=Salinicola salarius TaxID=430457 RepID=UPI000DA1929B|nr:hypothetical protein [Salinicola salarius]
MLGLKLKLKRIFNLKAEVALFVLCLIIVSIADLSGDRGYVLRLAQSSNSEPLYLLIGTMLGFLLREPSDEHAQGALVFALFAVFFSMLLAALSSLENDPAWLLGVALMSGFLSALISSVAYLFFALRARARADRIQSAKPPHFIRTKPPRYH